MTMDATALRTSLDATASTYKPETGIDSNEKNTSRLETADMRTYEYDLFIFSLFFRSSLFFFPSLTNYSQ